MDLKTNYITSMEQAEKFNDCKEQVTQEQFILLYEAISYINNSKNIED